MLRISAQRTGGIYTVMKGYFDGASRSNPGEAGAGSLLVDDDGKVIWSKADYLGVKTNNEAEYTALINLLAEARARNVKQLDVYGDSKLVISQVTHQWKIKMPHLFELASKVWELAQGMDVSYSWVPREQNKLADALSNEAIDRKNG